MTEEEIAQALYDHVMTNATADSLDPDGHYAFCVVGFCRPDNPDEWAECETAADRKVTVGSINFVVGCGTEQHAPIEQVLAKAVHFINHERLPAMIKEAQDVLRKREGMLQ